MIKFSDSEPVAKVRDPNTEYLRCLIHKATITTDTKAREAIFNVIRLEFGSKVGNRIARNVRNGVTYSWK